MASGSNQHRLRRGNAATAALLVTAAALALAACDRKGAAPDGQVVATLDGTDITIHEVNAEAAGLAQQSPSTPRRLIEAVALNRVLERKMLAGEARTKKLDQSPQFVLAKARTDENLLVQALQGDIAGKVPETPRETAQKYVDENPETFAQRRIITLDQIQFLRPANFDRLPLTAAKTMAQVEDVLQNGNVEYRRAPQQLDTLVLDPRLSREVIRLAAGGPNGEPFLFSDQPAGAPAPVIYINVVSTMRTEPFTGEKAISYAKQLIQRQEISKRLQAELTRVRDANKAKIVYGAGYDTPEKVAAQLQKAAKPAAGAPAPAPSKPPAAPAP